MELYKFAWGVGSDEECYSFYANTDRESIIKAMKDYKALGGDVAGFDEFWEYIYNNYDFDIERCCHEEPIYISENDLND